MQIHLRRMRASTSSRTWPARLVVEVGDTRTVVRRPNDGAAWHGPPV